MIKMISLILGGGAGSRLYPLTSERSKPAVPIGGKYRLIDIPISNCLNSGVRRMFVVTQFNSASLNQHIKNTYNFDMFTHGFVDILAAEQTPKSQMWFQGTADAVRQSMHHLATHDHDYILVLSGDQLYQMDFAQLAEYHIEQEADLTIATIPVTDQDAPAFGIMKVNADGFIDNFIEKPSMDLLTDWKSAVPEAYSSQGKHYLASMGIYIFKREFLERLFRENPEATDFGKEIIPIAIESGFKVASYAFDEYWTDIGTIRSFFEANIALTDNIPDFNLFDNEKTIYTRPRLLAPAKVFGTWFNKAIIAEGCIIHAKKIERSVVGIRARIGEGTEIAESIVMGNDYYETMADMERVEQPMGIGKNGLIQHAIVDKNCRIGDGVTIKGGTELADTETDTYVVRDGIIVLKKGAHIPTGTTIGLGADA
ncbi:MAG: glucose-1-phosphate adenylyltransferase [Bacteroidetes bacterium]|jgi:glucose-1-phosphate adenylyltransferase|nr:glucose-1-phosphate adenylyltransferase [Bacteroidota bacterium]